MEHQLKPGLHLSKKFIIDNEDLASTIGTGSVAVAATPSLLIYMEKVICEIVSERIPESHTTVSAEINIKHMLPASEGDEVACSVHLKFVEDSKLFFDFAIFNKEEEIIAIGAHERILVKKEDF